MPLNGRVKVKVTDLIDLIERRKAEYLVVLATKNADLDTRFNEWKNKKVAELRFQAAQIELIQANDEEAMSQLYSKYRDYSMPQREQEKTTNFDADLAALRMSSTDEISVGTQGSAFNHYF